MASDDIATGHNVKLDDDDWTPNPAKTRVKKPLDAPITPPPAPVVNTITPPPAITPPPVAATPPAFTPSPSFSAPAASTSSTSASPAASEGGTSQVAADAGFSEFINKRWRPMMAFIYMVTCTTDFVVFPVLWSVLQTLQGGQVTSQWAPLTLQGAGLYHIAMGAVLGLAAYGRSQEKIAGKA
jgi:hypothetical protein